MFRLKVLLGVVLGASFLGFLILFHSTYFSPIKDPNLLDDLLPKSSEKRSEGAQPTKGLVRHREPSETEVRQRQYARRGKIQAVCKENGLDNPASKLKDIQPRDFSRIYVDDNYKLLYCEVPKVACTNWKKILLILTGKMNTSRPEDIPGTLVHTTYQEKYLRTLDTYKPKQILNKIQNYYKFMFVREPLQRIVSAFRDKFLQKSSTTYQLRIGRKIVKRFRHNPSQHALEHGDDVTFQEFVEYLLDLSKQNFDPHWRPYYKLCHPCMVQYDFVGKYATMREDVEFVLDRLGGSHLIDFPQGLNGIKTSQIIDRLFSNVTDKQIHDLWKLYSVDYAMFDYPYPDVDQRH